MTCRRVQDCCATLHNLVCKWKRLTEDSFDLIKEIVNNESKYGTSHSVLERIEKRESTHKTLLLRMEEMEQIVFKMGSIVLSFRSVQELILVSSLSESESGELFSLLAMDTYVSHSEDIFQAYSEELSMRQAILKDILGADRDLVTVYLSLWLHQSIPDSIHDKLDCLLIDCGHKNP